MSSRVPRAHAPQRVGPPASGSPPPSQVDVRLTPTGTVVRVRTHPIALSAAGLARESNHWPRSRLTAR